MSEATTEKVINKYQWIKGDNLGNIEIEKEVKDGFIIFESGRRIIQNLLNEYLISVSADADVLNLAPISANGLIPTGQTIPKVVPNVSHNLDLTPVQAAPVNPIQILLEKQSKNNKLEISLNLTINIPKKEVMELLQDSFEEDIIDEIEIFAKSKLDDKEILKQVHENLKSNIKLYYK